MKLGEFVESTQYLDKDAHLIVFAEGKFYPIITIQTFGKAKIIELGCGWAALQDMTPKELAKYLDKEVVC